MQFFFLLLILIIPIIQFFGIWFKGFTTILASTDEEFPGKSDKVLWVILYVVLPLFAPFLHSATIRKVENKKRTTEGRG